jgi:hypothetical protein
MTRDVPTKQIHSISEESSIRLPSSLVPHLKIWEGGSHFAETIVGRAGIQKDQSFFSSPFAHDLFIWRV